MTGRLLLLGTGELARSVCCSLALGQEPVTVTVVGRDPAKAAELAYLANTRAAISGTPVRCQDAVADLTNPAALDRVVRATRPHLVLLAASHQSPWEGITAPSAWTDLLDRTGFGITAPLHATLAATVARVLAPSGARLLVGCYPDAVNPILAGLGLPVYAGIGNVATLAASLRAALNVGPSVALRVLAHHAHLDTPAGHVDEARAWLGEDGTELPDLTTALAAQRATGRRALNLVTGHAAATLIQNLLAGGEIRASLPGPLGLPGGYPVRITDRIELDLPAGLDAPTAVAWNRAAARRDGIDVADGRVRFSPAVRNGLDPHLPGLAAGFSVDTLDAVATELLALRTRLRTRPARQAA